MGKAGGYPVEGEWLFAGDHAGRAVTGSQEGRRKETRSRQVGGMTNSSYSTSRLSTGVFISLDAVGNQQVVSRRFVFLLRFSYVRTFFFFGKEI